MKIGHNILKIREKKSLSRKELAAKIGVSETQIGYYERSENFPSQVLLAKIAKVLEVKIADLYGETYGSGTDPSAPRRDRYMMERLIQFLASQGVSGDEFNKTI